MKIRKYFLLVIALVFINFLNLNASQKRLGEKEATNSLVSSTKLNLVQKNNKKIFTIEVYRSNGKLSTKSEYELEDKDKNIEKRLQNCIKMNWRKRICFGIGKYWN